LQCGTHRFQQRGQFRIRRGVGGAEFYQGMTHVLESFGLDSLDNVPHDDYNLKALGIDIREKTGCDFEPAVEAILAP